MNQKIKKSATFFSIICTILIILSAFVQPISARASGQVEILEKYKKQLKTTDFFNEKLINDNKLKPLLEKIIDEKTLLTIAEQFKYVTTEKDFKILLENYADILKQQPEYNQIKSIIKTKYHSDIQKIKTFYYKSVNNNDDELLLQTLIKKYSTSTTTDVHPMKAKTFSSDKNTGPEPAAASKIKVHTTITNTHATPVLSGSTGPIYGSGGEPDWVPWFPGKIIISLILAFIHFISVLTGNCNGVCLGILLWLWKF